MNFNFITDKGNFYFNFLWMRESTSGGYGNVGGKAFDIIRVSTSLVYLDDVVTAVSWWAFL